MNKVQRLMFAFGEKAFFASNPANGIAQPTQLRVDIANGIASNPAIVWDIVAWALRENINIGSNQKSHCPIELKGSGRWEANDRGGDYLKLRDLAISAWKISHLMDDARAASLIFVATGEIVSPEEIDATSFLKEVIEKIQEKANQKGEQGR